MFQKGVFGAVGQPLWINMDGTLKPRLPKESGEGKGGKMEIKIKHDIGSWQYWVRTIILFGISFLCGYFGMMFLSK